MCIVNKCRSILLLQMCIAGGLGMPGSARERTSSRNAFVSKAWLHMWFSTVSWINYRHLPIIKGQIHAWLKRYSSLHCPPSEHLKQLEAPWSGFKHSNKGLCEQRLPFWRSDKPPHIFDAVFVYIFCKKCIIKQLLDSVFVISRIIKVSAPAPTYLDLDYFGYHKNLIW